MKKLKKALVFLLVMSFLMSALAACGKRGDDKKENDNKTPETSQTGGNEEEKEGETGKEIGRAHV